MINSMNGQPFLENGPVRLKQCRHGFMLYLTTDKYIGQSLDRYGEFSEGEAEVFTQLIQPDSTVLEVGANIGSHTALLARLAGPKGIVHAFEPQRTVFQILCANIALNGIRNVHTHQVAVGRTPGSINVPQLDSTAVNNFGGLALGNWAHGEQVPVITIDSLNLPNVRFIKIDVEGMESDVIAGAQQTIKQNLPVMYLENDRKEKSPALIRQLLDLGYRLYWHLPSMFNSSNFFGSTENIFPGIVSANMLGIHSSISQNIENLREIKTPEDYWQV
jgi:FkbM family methyltransferase